jgi:hypothetical protein
MCNQAYIKKQTWASKMREALETKARGQQANKWVEWLKQETNLKTENEKDSEST